MARLGQRARNATNSTTATCTRTRTQTRVAIFIVLAMMGCASAALCAEEVLDASGTADVHLRLKKDPVTGKSYLPRQEIDKKALLKRFEELFKEFTTRQQQVEKQYVDQYPMIYVPIAPDEEPVDPVVNGSPARDVYSGKGPESQGGLNVPLAP